MNNSGLAKRHTLYHIGRVKTTFTILAIALTALRLTVSAVGAAEWPMFRGAPALTGVASGNLPDKPALLWTFKTQGAIRSSPAIAQGRVFVGSNDRHLYALDFATGKQIWAVTNSDAIESSPLALNGTIYVGANDANLYAFNAATGKQLWKF